MFHRTLSLGADRWRLLVVGALMGLVGCSAGLPQDLRGPGRQKGQILRSETRIVMKNGKLVMSTGGQRMEGACDIALTNIEEDHILEVEGGRVTKQQTTIISDDQSASMRLQGETDSATERGPLVGEKILREQKDGKWSNTLAGKESTPKQKKELESLGPLENGDDLYPEGKVKPGHTWKVDPSRLRKFFGPRCTTLTGEASMTFVKSTTLDGESCALINFTMDIKGKMLDDDNNEKGFELSAKGPEYRSLRSGYNLKSSLSGTMKETGTVVNERERVRMEMSGPVTIETVNKLK